jgi:hypothetical protein
MSMLTCTRCEGFIPTGLSVCPHCEARAGGVMKKIVTAAAGGAVALTLMACYGGGPGSWMPPEGPPTGTCASPADDIDKDGYCQDDCDEVNASVHPGASEIPGDGIDQDCVGGDAPAAGAVPPPAPTMAQ